MRSFLLLLLIAGLTACIPQKPAAPSIIPSVFPSLVPSVFQSPASSTSANTPSPLASADAPTSEPTRALDRSVPELILLPKQERIIDLGPANFADYYNPRPLALDAIARRLYVSLSPTRTAVLDAESLTILNDLPAGGALSVDPERNRLYVGVPGAYLFNPDGTNATTPAELRLFDRADLKLLRSIVPSGASTLPPLVDIDPENNKAYLTQNGVTIADATTLEIQGTLSGTFSSLPLSSFTAVDAAIDPQRQRLFVSLNNNIPGSNGGTVLSVYDLTTGRVINQDFERSVLTMAIDPETGNAVVPHSHIATYATVKYDAQGNILKRLDGASGLAQIDPQHNRIYLVEGSDPWRLKVLDRDLNFLGVIDLPGSAGPQGFILDAERDRLLILQNDGKLLALKGQGQPSGLAGAAVIPYRSSMLSIYLSPGADRQLFAIFAPDEYTSGYGALFRSGDVGTTWEFAAGLPEAVADLGVADQTIFAAVGGNGATRGYGVWRSDDGGQTWLPSSHGLTDLGVTRLVISPDFAHDGTLFALSKRGVFRSSDRGATWTSLADRYKPLLQELTVTFHALAVSPDFARDNTVMSGHSSGVWRSTDRGETWMRINGGLAVSRLAYAPGGSIVFALDDNGVHRSDNGGMTWQPFNAGLDLSNSTVSGVQANDREAVLLLMSFDQPGAVYRLPLNETTWQRVPIEADVTAVTLTPDGRLFIGTKVGTVQQVN